MAWNTLTDISAIGDLAAASQGRPQLIFKHSTRCGISTGALRRMEGGLDALAERFDLHYLDLLAHRPVSNHISDHFDVEHHSPQVIVVDRGEVTFTASHGIISPEFILEQTT